MLAAVLIKEEDFGRNGLSKVAGGTIVVSWCVFVGGWELYKRGLDMES